MDKERRKKLLKLGGLLLVGIIGHELAEEFLNDGDSVEDDEVLGLDDVITEDFASIPEPDINIDDSELDDLDDLDESEGQYNPTFGRSPSEIERDIDYYEDKLRNAKKDVEYYTKKLSNFNISDTFRRNCEFSLKTAVKYVETYTEKIANLIKELQSAV